MEAIKALTEGADLTKLLPDLSTFLGKVEALMRIAIMIAPLVLLGFGLLYFLAAPKEANYKLGYRCFWGMSSVEAWQFTQKLAGIVWSILGFVLCIVMTVQSGKFQGMEADAMAYLAMKYLLVELVCVVVSILLINLTVFVCFNHKGILREFLQRGPSQRSPRNRANRR
jgi:hypothetical protein